MNTCAEQSSFNNISKFNKCANCGACYNLCPTKAITVKDELFFSVTVDESKCVNCGKCVSVCPVNSPDKVQNITAAYSAEHKDKALIAESSSGGAFSAFAEYILAQGGVVWGACYNDGCDAVLFKSTNDVSLDALRRSKYVESSVGNSFAEIKSFLARNVKVLFCGAPCQVAGLKRFIGEHENLYTADFSCGGLGSHKLYLEMLKTLKRKYRSEVSEVNFRSKYFGWGTHCISVTFENGKKYLKPAALDPYFSAFIAGKLSVREYCYECSFSDNHYADLILADYWKYKDTYSSQNLKGISLVLINSEKGQLLLDKVSDNMHLRELPLDKATYNIKPTQMSDSRYKKRKAFLEQAEQKGLICAARAHSLPSSLKKLAYLARVYIKKVIQRR